MSAWYTLAACTYAAEIPTRAAIIAYNDECKAAGVEADFIAKFGADFTGLELSGVDFSGPHAVGLESNLRGANFRGANLLGARFGAAVLDRASFRDADLRDAGFITASLQHADLRGAKLAGASIRESNLAHADVRGVSFAQSDISGSDFPLAKMEKAKLSGAASEYWSSDFGGANLAEADLSKLSLQRAQFRDANLRGANFLWADLEEAEFTGANLTGAEFYNANITHADFRQARGLTEKQRRELDAQSGIRNWERERHIKAFLDSPWFPLALLAVVPGLAWTARLTQRGRRAVERATTIAPEFQFSLHSVLLIVSGVAIFLGVMLWSVKGLFSLAMVVAGYLMIDPAIYDAARRPSALRLLLAAGIYTVGTVALLPLIGSSSGFIVLWLVFGIIVGPVAMIVAGTCWAAHAVKFSGLAATGYVLWMIGLGIVNLYLLGELMSLA